MLLYDRLKRTANRRQRVNIHRCRTTVIAGQTPRRHTVLELGGPRGRWQSVRKVQLKLLMAAFGAGLMWVCSSACLADAALLRSLASAPAAKLPARAADLLARQPEDTRSLTLDLIFYRWANAAFGLAPGIDRLDQIAAALASASADPAVIWAAATLGPPEWATRSAPPESADERIRLLSQARQALLAAVKDADTYPTRSTESLKTCAAVLDNLRLELSSAFLNTRLAERQLYSVRRYRDALASYNRAYPTFADYGLRAQVARIFDDLGHLNSERGRYDDAYASYSDSAREWQALGFGDLAGKQYVNAGAALAAAGEPGRALRTMLYGLEFSRRHAWSKNTYGTHAQLLLQVASYCSEAGHAEEAQGLLTEAEEVAGRSGDPLLLASVLQASAAAWKEAKQEQKARGCLDKREKTLSRAAQEGVQAAAKLADLSIPRTEQARLLPVAERGAAACVALGRYQQGVDILKSVAAIYEIGKRDEDRIRALRSLASGCDALGDRQAALIARRQAAEVGMRIGKRALVVEILRDIQQSALDAQDPGTALEALREAVQVIEDSRDMLALAEVLESRGTLLEEMGQPADAMRDLEKAAAIYGAELGEPWSQARALEALAGIQAKAERPQDAIRSFAAAIQRIEEWAAAEEVDPDAEPGHADTLFRLYLQLVGLQLHENMKEEVIEALRKARQHAWFSQLRSYLAASGEPVAVEVLRELDKTAGSLPVVTPRTQPKGPRRIAGDWKGVLSQAVHFSRLARAGRNLNRAAPIDAADIHEIRDKLPDDLALIEYVVTDSTVQVLITTKRTVACWELPATRDQVDAAVQALGKALGDTEKRIASGVPIPSVKNWSDPSLLPVLEPLFSLQKLLIEPIRGEIAKAKSLAFMLPKELAGVPFHALAREKGTIRFLVQDYAVSYMIPETLRSFSKPVHGPLDAKRARIAIFADTSGRVPGAASEANFIRAYYRNSQLYTGSSATAERFISAALSSNIVHIAAHHQADPNPAQDSIVLSGAPGGPGTIRFADLMRISSTGNPKLELAVLSACETLARSDLETARASHTAQVFALAGFPSVIGGLWKVSDAASVQLMKNFYSSLALSGRKAEALQRAQKSMIESKNRDFAHPFCWAGFALYGDPR